MPAALIAAAAPPTPRDTGAKGIVLEVRSDAAALRALAPQWEALAAEAAEPNPFYESWMLLPALEAYGAGRLSCIAVWDNGSLGALFPMRLERGFHGLPLRTLRSWGHRNMLLGTPLVRAKSAAKCIAALLQSGLAPLVEFDWLPVDGPFYGALAEVLAEGGYPWMATDSYSRALLVRERDPRPRFNSHMKNNLRRWQARLNALGDATPVRLAPGGDVAAWIEAFMRLEASGWKGRAGSAVACRDDDRRFVPQVFAEAFRRGRLLITGLDLDGRPLARNCILTGGEGGYILKIAYDENHASCSPGILAQVDNVRQFMEMPGLRWLDSLAARENRSYDQVWKDRRTFQRVVIGAAGSGRVAVAALPLMRLAGRSLRRARSATKPGAGSAA